MTAACRKGAQEDLLKKQEEALQFFYLRRVRNKTELTAILKTPKSDTAKKAFLQLQLKTWYRGLRPVDPRPFSNGKDKTIGGVIELTTRLQEVVSTRHQIPARPPIETKDPWGWPSHSGRS